MSAKPSIPAATPVSAPADTTSDLEKFLDQNFRKILFGVILIIVAVVITSIFRHRAKEAATLASIAAANAKTPQDCDLVVTAHPGTVAAGNAQLKKAKLLWDENKKDSSVAVLRDFVAKNADHPFIVQGLVTLGTRLESMGTLDEAKKIYEQIVAEHAGDTASSLAELRIGDILWQQGKEAEAKKIYEGLPKKFPGSPFFEDTQSRLEWLGAGLPTKEVDAPKPPPASIAKPPAAPAAPGAPKAPTATITPGGAATTQPIKIGQPQPIKLPPPPAPAATPAAPPANSPAKPAAVPAPAPTAPAAAPKPVTPAPAPAPAPAAPAKPNP